ncbi:conserved protein of unknown function [Rhodovastum atsumiense]|uniref:CopL family metal-binding regulatory protein n=1 Tax=Rhodovastum atsumiense TaxID=504468 RepID=A0A5M6J100_9PROT|nr:hypothetical protein [Rhodovastum atsumiense]KAA5614264.1 hypothetical protein F1189_01315 [Rhodovastum atsumiense]CAH2604717.1 conserved protein of unknown function [Rhodovastum atsumiense]
MRAGLLRRLGLILVAIAFLGGAAPRINAQDMNAQGRDMAGAATMDMAMMDMACHAFAGPGQDSHEGHGQAPSGCDKRSHDCVLACAAACSIVLDHRSPAGEPVRYAVLLRHIIPASTPARGISHKPPLFPPIAA